MRWKDQITCISVFLYECNAADTREMLIIVSDSRHFREAQLNLVMHHIAR